MATDATGGVRSVETLVLRAPIDPPRGPSIAFASVHEYVVVALTDETGLTGWGETYAVPGTAATIADVAGLIVGADPVTEAEAVRRRVAAAADHAYAASAVSIAIDDLRARRLGVPVWALYGGRRRRAVRAYAAHGGYVAGEPTEATWLADAAQVAASSFTAMKVRIGRAEPAIEIPLLRRVRDTLPEGTALLVDGNGGYSPHAALAVGRALADLGVSFFEEPLPQHDGYTGYPALRRRLALPLAGGEILGSRREALRLLSAGAFDIVQPEPVICGGIGEAIWIAQLADAHGIGCTPHTSGGGIGIAAALQVIATLADDTPSPAATGPLLEMGIDPNPFREGSLREPIAVGPDGRVAIPEGPGLGVEVDADRLRGQAVERLVLGDG